MVRVLFKVKLICFILCFTQLGEAKVKLPALISEGMVLQREQNIRIWGTADPGEPVVVTFLKKKYNTEADAQGNWRLTLPPSKAGGPYVMKINDLEINNILIGDVYLCSGQSNMELPVSRVTDLFREEVSAYANPMIRYVKVPLSYNFHGPQSDIRAASWQELTPGNAMQFSALCYFFAREMYDKNKIPVGLINSSVGGSPVEAWISEEALKPFPLYTNDMEIYQSDEYLDHIRSVERTRRDIWNKVLYKNDAGLHGTPKWFDAACNDSGWTTVDLFDTSWNNNGLNAINGSHWFRKEIDIPAGKAGQEAVLRMGCIVDADSVFVNGTFVGTVAYQYPPRIYPIPKGLLKAGKNTVTVRLVSYGGRPHFVPEKPYKLVFGDGEISLEGEWKYKQGTPMPPLQGETPFQYKPTGLYNAMIAPLIGYGFKGAIWYQGESNTARYNEYYDLLTTMIADWRDKLDVPLPFIIVELAEFGRPDRWDAFREVQRRVAENTPNAALAPAKDLGEWNDIHPLNKKDAGIRVANEMQRIAFDDKPITGNRIGVYNGFDYELWRDKGDVSMVLKEGGAFECRWNKINNVLFRTGKKLGSTQTHDEVGTVSISYGCDYQPVGNSYLCVYGWSVDPLIEFYIVEAWGNWRPPGAKSKGTVEIDGGVYDIYETTRIEQPSIQGNTTFQQYWSVRTEKKTKGTISVSKHFEAWERMGMKLGKMYEIALCVEGYRSSGTADVYEHTMTIGGQMVGLK